MKVDLFSLALSIQFLRIKVMNLLRGSQDHKRLGIYCFGPWFVFVNFAILVSIL